MARLVRTVSRLLSQTYCALGDAYIQTCLLEVWEKSESGEAVAAEAFVALERASRQLTRDKHMTFARLEDTEPNLIKPLFEAAITITEAKSKVKAGTK